VWFGRTHHSGGMSSPQPTLATPRFSICSDVPLLNTVFPLNQKSRPKTANGTTTPWFLKKADRCVHVWGADPVKPWFPSKSPAQICSRNLKSNMKNERLGSVPGQMVIGCRLFVLPSTESTDGTLVGDDGSSGSLLGAGNNRAGEVATRSEAER